MNPQDWRLTGIMILLLVIITVAFLAYANGANDNFKGVASLYGSGTCSYGSALTWATVTTAAGSIAALFLASTLLKNFSGKGLVPDALTISPVFMLAVACGAGGTVLLATRLGFPISTTHGLTGALVGAGMMAGSNFVNYGVLGKAFVMPLLLSPLLALLTGAIIYLLFKGIRVADTMSHKLTDMNPGQGFAANLSTALLVTTASLHGLPVSTTDVSVGALLGMGTVTGQAKWKSVLPVLASWIITLPVAASLSAASYFLFQKLHS